MTKSETVKEIIRWFGFKLDKRDLEKLLELVRGITSL